MDRQLNGSSPLAYLGVNTKTPSDLVIHIVAPTVNDSQNINIGTLWMVKPPLTDIATEVWLLTTIVDVTATWVQIYPASGSGVTVFPCDSGSATSVGGILNILGDSNNIDTSGSGNTVLINLSNGSNGEALIGGSTEAQWNLITSSTIDITPGVNALNMDIAGAVSSSFGTDNGVAIPAAGALTIHGGSNIATSAAVSTVTSSFDNNIDIPDDVTVLSLTEGVVQSNSSGLLSSSEGTDGQLLISSATSSQWNNLTSTGGTISITNGANSINLETTGGMGSLGVGNYAFLGIQTTDLLNATGDNTLVSLGALAALTESFDVGNNFNPGNGAGTPATFTAPATGYYHFEMQISLRNSKAYTIFYINTTQRNYRMVFNASTLARSAGNIGSLTSFSFSTIANMNINDTAVFQVQAASTAAGTGTKTMGILHDLGLTLPTVTSVSGFKIG